MGSGAAEAAQAAVGRPANALLGLTKAGHREPKRLAGQGEPELGPDLRRLVRRLEGVKPKTIRALSQIAVSLKRLVSAG